MEKVFDHISWDFIDFMLERLGFGTNGEVRLKHAFLHLVLRSWLMAVYQIFSLLPKV